ncbi:alanine racemase [Orrella sp. JC864]|uniref:alanine racemase n=1 Tax=Orrella sp. JC864 TaxID=3120298 RepID=UPI0012BCBD12
MPRPISAAISAAALAHNLQAVQALLAAAAAQTGAPAPPNVWAVIKANAYGHGVRTAVRGFSAAQGLAMLDLDEAVRCREAGWVGPILLLEGIFEPADIELLDRYHLTSCIHHDEQLAMLGHARPRRRLDAYVKLNAGMNRLGFSPMHYRQAHARARALREQGVLGTVGKMAHFSFADGPEGIAEQHELFLRTTAGLSGPVSVCNSAALLRFAQVAARADGQSHWVRPGICLYGASPFAGTPASVYNLKPAMTLRSRLIAVQRLQAGDRVGYAGLFTASGPMRVGVVACGYADGYPRHACTGTPVTVGGVRTRVLGRVSMDMLVVDLEPVPTAGVGTQVVLWGEGGPTVDEVAESAGTIGYELLCALAPRVPLVFPD